jgi:hypothetical protein
MATTNDPLSIVAMDSTNVPHRELDLIAPIHMHATPHLASDNIPAPAAIVCPTVTYETQFDIGCQVRVTYSNNTDDQDNHNVNQPERFL